jgi:nucleoside 2-deoxyribosyltransferase
VERAALDHPLAAAGFAADFKAMEWADACVLVLPCGRSAHVEAGWMKGAGKKVFAYMPEAQEPELMYKLFDGICTKGAGLMMFLEGLG